MPKRQTMLFTLAFLAAALAAAAVVLVLRRPRQAAALAETSLPDTDPGESGSAWLPGADEPGAWWGTR